MAASTIPHSPFGLVKRFGGHRGAQTSVNVHTTFIRGGLLGLGYPWAASCLGRDPTTWYHQYNSLPERKRKRDEEREEEREREREREDY
jgi:hypothetical protein